MSENQTLTVTGMKCGGCETNVTQQVSAIEGVISVSADHKENQVDLEFDETKTSIETIIEVITEAGFAVE